MTDRGDQVLGSVRDVVLARLVAEGRAIAPTGLVPLPEPPVLGDPEVDVATQLAVSRQEAPW